MTVFDRLHSAVSVDGGLVHSLLAATDRGEPLPVKAYVPVAELPAVPSRRALVSVIIPCYNYGRFLDESVGSALSQSDVDIEVIVVDDASTDDSATVAERLAAGDHRVRLVRNEANSGHVVTFNNGYAHATGELIVRLDADDLLTPGALARAVAVFEAFPEVGLVYGNPLHFESAQPPAPKTAIRGWTVWDGHDWLAERCRTGVNCITTPEAVVRASVMARVGGLNTELKYAQDMEMWLRVSAVSDVAHIEGPDQALHRDHPSSMSVTVGSGVLTDLLERRRVFDVLFAGVGGRLVDAAALHRVAADALAAEALDRACRSYDRGRGDSDPVEEYIAFAEDVSPDAHQLKQWRAWLRRRRVGSRWSPRTPPFIARAVVRRINDEVAYGRWIRTGL